MALSKIPADLITGGLSVDPAAPADAITVDSSGNVGIGTSSPSYKLDVSGSIRGDTFVRATSGSVNSYLVANGGGGFGVVGTATNHPLLLNTNDIERMRIDSSGDVLIGRTSAVGSEKLSVNGSIQCEAKVSIFSTTATANLSVQGSVSKGSGSFKIDHPLPELTETHHLVHSFVEAPQADNIYRGKVELVDGRAEVNIDTNSGMTEGTFVLLNREVQCFTSNESDWDAVRGSVNGNILTIECQNTDSTATISWLVIGERQDQHMYDTDWTDENGKVIVEPLKFNPEEGN